MTEHNSRSPARSARRLVKNNYFGALTGTTPITPMEQAVLEAIYTSDYHDGRDPFDEGMNQVWTFSCFPSGIVVPVTSRGGVFASLVKKGLIGHHDAADVDDNTCWLLPAARPYLKHMKGYHPEP